MKLQKSSKIVSPMQNKPLRIVFMGTPELCLPYLEAIENSPHSLIAVITNPDRPTGRKQILTAPPVKTWANQHTIPVWQPEDFDQDFVSHYQALSPDLAIVVAYGQILPKTIIDTPRLGTLNVHYSLLPRWRGASPVEAAILAGDNTTGVSIQQMVQKLDQGPVLAHKSIPITDTTTSPELRTQLTALGSELLLDTIDTLAAGNAIPTPQDPTLATYCAKINKTDAEISLNDDPVTLWRKYRAYLAWPRLYYFDETNRRVIITEAAFSQGKFQPTKILPAGGKEIVLHANDSNEATQQKLQ